ncbi:DNA-3-methyladenine glycosylase 2 family protein [Pseudenhygromyxa sp. WMMC2535]|uniref:DNA-3-methyladenine glycosylase family protein n=1 Tax=Pseudenhygromyxa sp. WMMC2535 TaxID=2712867 RepID=UPI001552F376|nr:DNA-3-methyladenine glycosylase 2 family protein [Pseudenhygromyxa sp. WMMC2535]NVB43351.1 DNA-3-methyladenine glycosylase 2 family protein [Pseudenhygromyxa sp. WMMC2535]
MSERRRDVLTGPYDLGRSLFVADHGSRNPTIRQIGAGELHRATHTPEGPAALRVLVDPSAGTVDSETWGPGASWLLARVPSLLGLDDRPPRLEGLPGRLQRRCPGVRMVRAPSVFELLVAYVLRQRVAWRDAVATQYEIQAKLGVPAPGPLALQLPPSAAQWRTLGATDLAAMGIERKRARTILGLAARADRVSEWAALAPEAFAAKIELLPGIGPWTSGMVRGWGLGDPDVVPLGDYELPSMVAWGLTREARADDARMVELLAPWAGQRFRVIRQLWAAGIRAPRFGPRIRGQRPR